MVKAQLACFQHQMQFQSTVSTPTPKTVKLRHLAQGNPLSTQTYGIWVATSGIQTLRAWHLRGFPCETVLVVEGTNGAPTKGVTWYALQHSRLYQSKNSRKKPTEDHELGDLTLSNMKLTDSNIVDIYRVNNAHSRTKKYKKIASSLIIYLLIIVDYSYYNSRLISICATSNKVSAFSMIIYYSLTCLFTVALII